MKSRIRQILLFFIFFILVVDGISFTSLIMDFPIFRTSAALAVYWIITTIFIIILCLFGKQFLARNKPGFFARFYVFTGVFLAFYVPKLCYLLFFILEILVKLLSWPFMVIFTNSSGFGEYLTHGPIYFVSMLILPISLLAFVVVIGGILFGRFNFKVRPIDIHSSDLPSEFDGFRIIHISDLHLGSLHGKQNRLRKAIELINNESADLILFTGDLVNNLAEETEGWTDLLSEMKAKLGKFSILGNHDYGEYYNWPDEASRQANINSLIKAHRDSGFSILLNRSAIIQKGEAKIYLAGVENWGLPPFKQYGDLNKALRDVPEDVFSILLSHDPSHWDEEVISKTRVQLTLSGHTHGMQFGIRTKKFKWSPVQFKYPRWIGLYKEGAQFLHVNPGIGYIGYAGRIGIPPEISLITLRKN